MSVLLLENIDTLATFNDQRQVLNQAWILIRDGWIEALGTGLYQGVGVERRMNLAGHIVLPGLINLHHHFFQALLRNIPTLQDVSLFRWLNDIQMLIGEFGDEELSVAVKINVAELLLSGCTTTVDHNYLKASINLHHDTAIQAAREMGIRYHHARGSNGRGYDQIIEKEDDVLADTERLIKTYHDNAPGAMVRIDNAPGAPFSMSQSFFRESIEMARRYGVGNHTHLAESAEVARVTLEQFGKKSVHWAQDVGWLGPDVWFAHATALDEEEKTIIRKTGTGICHCPNSNMYTNAGICQVTPMLKKGGFKIGLGVDGSAANNSSNLLRETRAAMLLQRIFYGAGAMSPTQALELAILGGAKVLRREDIGVLAPGKAADIIGFDLNRFAFAGGQHDPLAGLVLCDVDRVDLSIVNGVIRVDKGELQGIDLPALVKHGNELASALVQRTEKRFNISLTAPVWRRAYPYDEAAV